MSRPGALALAALLAGGVALAPAAARADRAAPAEAPPAPAPPPTQVTRLADTRDLPVGAKGARARLLVTGAPVALTLLTLPKGAELGWATHSSATLYVVLACGVTVHGGGKAGAKGHALGVGDAAYVSAGTVARVVGRTCKGNARAELLVLHAPAGPEERWFDAKSLVAERSTSYLTAKQARALPADAPQPRVARLAETAPLAIGGGKGQVHILFDAASAGDGAAYVGRFEATPGLRVPEHVHAGETEVLWILSGDGVMTVDGRAIPVGAGTAIAIPPGTRHAFTTDAGLTAVQFYTPSGPEQRFKAPPPAPAPTPAKKAP